MLVNVLTVPPSSIGRIPTCLKDVEEQELGKTEFHLATGYNRRWLVEAFFSFEKKRFGEWMRSRRFDRMVLTMQRRRILCSMYKRLYARARGYTSRNRQMASEGATA
ncbi:MAG: hypothetical protein MJZ38_05325 [archaeon]|nr:hypothetical protein [archaeon]